MLNKIPFIKLFLPFLMGIILYGFLKITVLKIALIIFIVAIVLLSAVNFLPDYYKFKWKPLNGLLLSACLIALGYAAAYAQHYKNNKHHYSQNLGKAQFIKATVLEPLIKRKKSFKTTVAINGFIDSNSHTVPTIGKALIYFTKTENAPQLLPGDKILFAANLISIKNNGNPGEFDYKNYCHRSGITHLCFAAPNQYIKNGVATYNFNAFFARQRIKTIAIIDKFIINPQANGIAQALLIGDKTDIDQDVWDDYSRTGIVHIIAISGMHMGIIYGGIVWLLALIPFLRNKKFIPISIGLIAMWFFAATTGLPSSVMRATIMFTFLAMGELMEEQPNSFNLLLVSAFVLLAYHPNWIYDIGFQLSYAAVTGILLIMPLAKKIFYSKKWLLQKSYELVAGTTTAQLFTLPICLYYFHQFPLSFLLANFVAIPLTTIVLYLEIALLLLHPIPLLAKFIGSLVSYLLLFVNYCIHAIAQIKHITIFNIYITQLQMVVLLLGTAILLYGIIKNKFNAILVSIGFVIFFYVLGIKEKSIACKQQKLIVYHIKKATSIDFFTGLYYEELQKDTLSPTDIKNANTPARILNQAINKQNNKILINKDNCFIAQAGPYTVWQITPYTNEIPNGNIDFVVLTQNTNINLELLKTMNPKCIIADGSNSLWKIEQWKTQSEELHLPFHSTEKQGAFVKQINT